MKRMILLVAAMAVLSGCAGYVDSYRAMDLNEMQMQKVVEVPGLTKDNLFDRSRMWFAETFTSSNAVIQYEDKANGTIIGKGSVSDSFMLRKRHLRILVTTEVKDNKARISVSGQNLFVEGVGQTGVQAKIWRDFVPVINDLTDSYSSYIKLPIVGSTSKDW